jgi:hypothetical protein
LGEAELDEFLILLPGGRFFALASLEKEPKGIGTDFIKFVVFNIIEVMFFKIF